MHLKDTKTFWADPGSCLPRAYVTIFSTVAINAVFRVYKKCTLSWRTRENLTWRTIELLSWWTGEHLHVFHLIHVLHVVHVTHVLQTYCKFSNPWLQDLMSSAALVLAISYNFLCLASSHYLVSTAWLLLIGIEHVELIHGIGRAAKKKGPFS